MITKDELVKEELAREKKDEQVDLSQKGWLTVDNAAIYADYSRSTIYSMMKDPINPLPFSDKNGRHIRKTTLDKYLEQFEKRGSF